MLEVGIPRAAQMRNPGSTTANHFTLVDPGVCRHPGSTIAKFNFIVSGKTQSSGGLKILEWGPNEPRTFKIGNIISEL